jgi:ribosomal protein S18 acetylase RimI-like enzyme
MCEIASQHQAPAIRQATSEDAALVAPLFDAYRQFYGRAPDLPSAEAYLHTRLSEGSSTVFLATHSDGRKEVPIGFTQLYPSFSSISLRPVWILYDLFVAPEARRQRVGIALLERARVFAVESGASEMTLETAIDNTAAQALYESLGWRRDEHFYTYILPL